MGRLKHELILDQGTCIYCEEEKDQAFGAPHFFEIYRTEVSDGGRGKEGPLGKINFQKGPVKENGVNGVTEVDLLNIVAERLRRFQELKYSSRENAVALTKIEEAVMWLHKRTAKRVMEKKEGTSRV